MEIKWKGGHLYPLCFFSRVRVYTKKLAKVATFFIRVYPSGFVLSPPPMLEPHVSTPWSRSFFTNWSRTGAGEKICSYSLGNRKTLKNFFVFRKTWAKLKVGVGGVWTLAALRTGAMPEHRKNKLPAPIPTKNSSWN